MDMFVPLIFLGVVLCGSLSIFLVFKYGIKKKTYEEALAEHRKQTTALIGAKPKPKEKKKKAAKKNLESDTADDASVESKDSPVAVKESPQKNKGKAAKQNKVHVEFKPEPEEVPDEVPVDSKPKERRAKKAKPILVKKESEQEINVQIEAAVPLNRFEEIHPKDEFERLRANSKEDILKADDKKSQKKPKNKIEAVEKEKEKLEEHEEVVVVAPVQEAVPVAVKEKKKKRPDAAKQQITERDHLIASIRNAELSRNELQLLIDVLLNKQLEAPSRVDEWSEGKSDPVQKLKRQLADREKQLRDEQDASVAVQAKLREIRAEQTHERAQLQAKVRAVEESKVELATAHGRLQQKLQELEEFRAREQANYQRLAEDNNALVMQRAKLEATVQGYQEAEGIVFSLKSENAQLTQELQLLTQERHELMTNYQNCLAQIQRQQEELEATQQYVKGLERNHAFALKSQQDECLKLAEQLDGHQKDEQRAQLQAQQNDDKTKERLLNLTNELSSVKSQLSSVNQSMLDAEKRHGVETAASSAEFDRLRAELDEQKSKNDKMAADIKSKEQERHRKFIERLFPDLAELNSIEDDSDYETFVELYFEKQKSDVVKLQKEAQHYKEIIDETESTLKKLQFHIEQEEQHWRSELSQKESEIRELKSQNSAQLEAKLATLEEQLASERAEKQRLLDERLQTPNGPEIKSVAAHHANSTATIEKLSEELERLKEQLTLEQGKNREATQQNGETS